MSATGLSQFDETLQLSNIWLKEIMENIGFGDRRLAYHAFRLVAHAIRDRLSLYEAAHLSAQLPTLLRGVYFDGWKPARAPTPPRSLESFLAPIGKGFDRCPNVEPAVIAKAVIATMSAHISDGEMRHVRESFPADLRSLFDVREDWWDETPRSDTRDSASDLALRDLVMDELDWEPRVEASGVGVTVSKGVVTLAGHVPDYAQMEASERAVRRVRGVRGVVQSLQVRPAEALSVSDDVIARKIIEALDRDLRIPSDDILAQVEDGVVTLTGEVSFHYQRRTAADAVSLVEGVRDLRNFITVRAAETDQDIGESIHKALVRRLGAGAGDVRISAIDGAVMLEGEAKSWGDESFIEETVWEAPGVTRVVNKLKVA